MWTITIEIEDEKKLKELEDFLKEKNIIYRKKSIEDEWKEFFDKEFEKYWGREL